MRPVRALFIALLFGTAAAAAPAAASPFYDRPSLEVDAGMFYDDVADKLLGSIDNETAKAALGYMIIFVGVTVIGQLLAFLVQPAMMLVQLGIADQLLGAFFGAVKAFVIIEALLILMVTYPRYDMDERINDSEFGSRMLEFADPILRILPDEFEARVNQFTSGIFDLQD